MPDNATIVRVTCVLLDDEIVGHAGCSVEYHNITADENGVLVFEISEDNTFPEAVDAAATAASLTLV